MDCRLSFCPAKKKARLSAPFILNYFLKGLGILPIKPLPCFMISLA